MDSYERNLDAGYGRREQRPPGRTLEGRCLQRRLEGENRLKTGSVRVARSCRPWRSGPRHLLRERQGLFRVGMRRHADRKSRDIRGDRRIAAEIRQIVCERNPPSTRRSIPVTKPLAFSLAR
jgi:hypothetical protein